MAITKLPTDFVDAVTSQKKYEVTNDGTYANITDVSEYTTQGSSYNSKQIRETRNAINEVITIAEDNSDNVSKLLDGTKAVADVTYADSTSSYEKIFTIDLNITTSNQVYTFEDSRITLNSIMEVFFDNSCIDNAMIFQPLVISWNGTWEIRFETIISSEYLPFTGKVIVRNK